ncbi:putative Isoflavone reductase [Melia azedarach]|uniref:Isoflavone reductase n=1 Tax=Melia azedarach TaxID=155640 RepID=A0ACC1YZR8_MELAZ|nr:putative Isoflavone reductase [Melia azedarach]
MGKIKVLIVGGTGYLGKRLVKASLALGHETYVLHRPEIGVDIEKVQMLLSFKEQGAKLVPGSFNDHQSLVDAVKLVDVVICAISGVHIRSHHILLQLKLVDAIKEAGNVKRFLPSEFGADPARMGNAMEPGRVTFDDKMVVRKAIEEAIYVDEDDIAMYTMKAIDDPRTLNKTLYIRPPKKKPLSFILKLSIPQWRSICDVTYEHETINISTNKDRFNFNERKSDICTN